MPKRNQLTPEMDIHHDDDIEQQLPSTSCSSNNHHRGPADPQSPPQPSTTGREDDGSGALISSSSPQPQQRRRFISKLINPPSWHGVRPLPLLISISIFLTIRFAIPKPTSLTPRAWQLFALFIATIAGLVLSPLPLGAWSFVSLTTALITKTLPFDAAFSALTNQVVWLIVVSFFFARGFVKSGLGDRLATHFVAWFGKSSLGLSYGLVMSEAIVSPAIPSTTARAGGVFCPVIKVLAASYDSYPRDPSARKLGAFLVQAQLQANSTEMMTRG